MEDSKWFFKSKTVWFAAITALAGFYAPARDFVAENLENISIMWAFIAVVLRKVSNEKIKLLP